MAGVQQLLATFPNQQGKLSSILNASWTRITRTTVRLANLPAAWRGRRAAVVGDVHLGHVRNDSFLLRMVIKMLKKGPDAIFIAGNLYDGTAINARRAAEPYRLFSIPLGFGFRRYVKFDLQLVFDFYGACGHRNRRDAEVALFQHHISAVMSAGADNVQRDWSRLSMQRQCS